MALKVIVDGDWGGDEMQLAAVLLAQKAEILGACCVFGNAPLEAVTKNACDILALLGAPAIKVYAGADGPLGEQAPEGDGAHGSDGVGGVILSPSPRRAETERASDFILETLRAYPPNTISLTATGPLSNIAEALRKDPTTLKRAKEIVIMGGCTKELIAADRPFRQGNITPFAEFNFYMAPKDAHAVLSADLPLVLIPMNCTQQMSVTPDFEKDLRAALACDTEKGDQILAMMKAPEALDRLKFDAFPFMHDVHTALYVTIPKAYEGERGFVSVDLEGETIGRSSFTEDARGNLFNLDRPNVLAPLHKIVSASLQTCLENALAQNAT